MGPRSRTLVVLALVVGTAMMSGCNVRDWFNQSGKIEVNLAPMGPQNTTLLEFRSLKVAIYGVSVKQVLIIDTKEFSFEKDPLVFDMVEKGTKGETIPLLPPDTTINIRAVESVTLRLDIVEAIDAQGRSMPICREGDPTTTFPCFFVPDGGVYRHAAQSFSTKRGGGVTFDYPLGVTSSTQAGQTEYFLFEDPSKVRIEHHN